MTERVDTATTAPAIDPVLLAVLANRFDAIVREMTNTLFRTGRSAVLNTAKDFSCSIVTAENELFASELTAVAALAQRHAELVSLYKALGGGWVDAADPLAVTPRSATP